MLNDCCIQRKTTIEFFDLSQNTQHPRPYPSFSNPYLRTFAVKSCSRGMSSHHLGLIPINAASKAFVEYATFVTVDGVSTPESSQLAAIALMSIPFASTVVRMNS